MPRAASAPDGGAATDRDATRSVDTPGELRARALRHLARREHSRAELEQKLGSRAGSGEVLNAVLDRLESRRQISDQRFAEERVRKLSSKYGDRRIRADLKARGIEADIVGTLPLDDEISRARSVLQRKYKTPIATPADRAKRIRFLISRGYASESAVRAIDGVTDLE